MNISTVATSEIMTREGKTLDRIPQWSEGAMVANVPLYTGETPALHFGAAITAVWVLIAAVGVSGTVGLLMYRRLLLRRPPARTQEL